MRIKALFEASPETRRYMLAGLASLTLNAVLIMWLTSSVDRHTPRIAPPPEPIIIDIVEEVAPEPAPAIEDAQPPQPVFKVQPETTPETEAPLAPLPPEARPDDDSAGAVASVVEAPALKEEQPAPDELEEEKRAGVNDIPPEWTVDRSGTTLEDFGEAPLFSRPQSGAGGDGNADRLRRILNAAACADLELSLRAGANCPPVGAYLRYAQGDSQMLSEADQKRLQLMFPESFLDRSKPSFTGDGALPEPTGENLAARKQGASSGMVGTLPEAHPHPYTQ